MKRIGNIRKKFLTKERIKRIVGYLTRDAKSKHWTKQQRKEWDEFMKNYSENVDFLYKSLRHRTHVPGPFKIFEKKEGEKMRKIYASYPVDQIVDTLLNDCLEYVFIERKKLIPGHCYGSIKNKGQHELRRKIIRKVKGQKEAFVYVGDTSKYYPTMNHEYLKRILRLHIKDQWMIWLCDITIDRMPDGKGVALGLPSSNILGHVYHSLIDWVMIADYGFKDYYRFCDDKYIIDTDKNYLHTGARALSCEVQKAGQTIKHTWRIVNCRHQYFDCLGALINSQTARLRPSSRRKMERHMLKLQRKPYNPQECLRAWSGMKGSLRNLNVGGLLVVWKDRYEEFFRRVTCGYRELAYERYRRRKHKRIERILTKAIDCRTIKIDFNEQPINDKGSVA